MNKNRREILLAIIAALALSGCSGAGEKTGGNSVGANAQSNQSSVAASSSAPAADGGANVASTNVASANVASANNNAVEPTRPSTTGGAAQMAGARGASSGTQAKMPTPQVGSGGNDLFLFTQARAAVNADPELKAANVILEVKDGVVTLSGTVASTAQKSKAEQLVREAGTKVVRNQLRVSVAN
jgi:osmotically-inducible protein OsmY